MKMVVYQEDTLGVVFTESEIPQDLQAQALTYREQLLEAVSDFDDSLMEKFLEDKEIAEEEIKAALRKATVHVRAVPVFCGASFKNKGVQRLFRRRYRLPALAFGCPRSGRCPSLYREAGGTSPFG